MSGRPLPAALLVLAGLSCAGPGFRYADLPEDPIWVVHRTREETERIAELIARRKEKEDPRRPRLPNEKYFRLEDVGDAFGIGPSSEERAADLLGRLAALDPVRRSVTYARFANRGARPLDYDPVRRRLLYLSIPRRTAHIFEYVVDTGEVFAVTHSDYDDVDACYGPDGRIVIARRTPLRAGEPGGVRLFLREPRGGEPRPITDGPLDVAPDWSPDGSRIVFQTLDAQGGESIATLEPDGDPIPRRIARGTAPVFTPDGGWIVYSAPTREGWRIWKMHADGTGRRPVGRSGHEEGDPAVSPDGRYVAFVSLQDERRRIVVRRIEGEGDRPLTTDGEGLRPVW